MCKLLSLACLNFRKYFVTPPVLETRDVFHTGGIVAVYIHIVNNVLHTIKSDDFAATVSASVADINALPRCRGKKSGYLRKMAQYNILTSSDVHDYERIIEDYERRYKSGKGDPLPNRIRILLKRYSGTNLENLKNAYPYTNINRSLAMTRNMDIPRLKKLYPSLYLLPL